MSADGAGPNIDVTRMPDGLPVASQGRARRRSGGARGRDDARRLDLGGRRRKPGPEGENGAGPALGEIEVTSEPLVSWAKRHRILRLPVIRGVVALGESLKIGFRALAISANAQLEADEDGEDAEPIGGFTWGLTIAFSLALAIGLFFVVPVGAHQPDQGRARLGAAVLARRGDPADGDLHRLHRRRSAACRTCAGCSSTTAPSTRRSPATRPATGSSPSAPRSTRACTRAAAPASC